jgi:N-acyl homoserine lactone hydrolase
MNVGGYAIDLLVQGYPGKSTHHGGLGWSTVALLRGHGRTAVLDTGGLGLRRHLAARLAAHGVAPAQVTDLLLSHLHYDHVANWPMFPNARITVGAAELAWALERPVGDLLVPEFYVRPLHGHANRVLVGEGDAVLPGLTAHLTPGHTPGHLTFRLAGEAHDVLFVQDAAKYRAELLTRRADMTDDPAVTAATIETIWRFWRAKPGTVVVPGHDRPLVLDAQGRPTPVGARTAGILAFLGETLEERRTFDLAAD